MRERVRNEVPDVADAALAALTTLEVEELARHIPERAATRTAAVGERASEDGRITSFVAERSGDIDVVQGETTDDLISIAVTVPYTASWTSEAAGEIVHLEGEFDIGYRVPTDDHEGEGEWQVGLGPSSLFPGIDGARGFSVEFDWPKRGAIVDRDGRKIAVGDADNRRYPFGTLAGTTVGHIGALSKQDIKQGATGEVGDLVGASGLEEAFQERLAGLPSSELHVVDRRGDVLTTVGEIEGTPAEKVKVTLDMELQRRAEAAYSGIGGAVVIRPKTGDILAAVDSSTFDPNNYVGAESVEPFNRALSGGYPPGSSMKVVTAAAALDTGTVKPSTTVTGPKEYQGVRNFESGEFGSIPFATAVKFSVNTAFAQVALDLGSKKLTRYAEGFGFNSEPQMPLEARTSSFPRPTDAGDLMWSSVGQAQVLATPLQMASVAATIANDGRRMEPRIDMSEPKRGERVVSRKTARELAAMMQAAVEGGTGVNARISGVAVAGKTGTAEVDVGGERRNHAWFVCFAPVGDARVAVAVVSEYGGIGGQVAAPMARSILVGALPLAP